LAGLFKSNFKEYEEEAGKEILAGGP